jgi:hypothetical protein
MENWEAVIIDNTNEKYALAMIIKFRAYRKRYPGVDLDSVAEEFSKLSLNDKRDWALRDNNMKSIVAICRMQRRLRSEIKWDKLSKECNYYCNERSGVNGYSDPEDEKYFDKYGWF